MLIKVFKSAQPISLFYLPILAALVVYFAFRLNPLPVALDHDHGVLYSFLLQIPGTSQLWVCMLISFVLVTLQVLFFNRIIVQNEVLYKPSNLPALLHLVSLSVLPGFLGFTPFLFINTLLLLVIHKTCKLYKAPGALGLAFDACFILAICTMLYSPCILLLLFFIISLSILRPFNWREWMVAAMGFVTPWILLTVFLFLSDQQSTTHMAEDVTRLKPFVNFKTLSSSHLLTIFSLLFLLTLALLKLRNNFYKNVIKMRKYQLCFFVLLLIMLLIIIIPFQHTEARFSLLAIPVSVFLAYYFMVLKRIFVFELLFTLLLAVVAYNYIR